MCRPADGGPRSVRLLGYSSSGSKLKVSQRRADFTGPALIRLLARLTEAEVPESHQAFADQLSQWLGWADAISLSAALNGGSANAIATAPSADARPSSARSEEGECVRVRAALAKAIAEDTLFAPPAPPAPSKSATRGQLLRNAPYEAPPAPPVPTEKQDFMPYRLRYQARQQAMDAGIGPLREKLRARLAAQSPDMARLAVLDGVMEQVLGEQERRLLGTVPAMLEKHFERLRRQQRQEEEEQQAQQAQPAVAGTEAAPQPSSQWLHRFGRDAQSVLMAELEIRFQPLEGLLEALRAQQIQRAHRT